jgi:hypothetical protein
MIKTVQIGDKSTEQLFPDRGVLLGAAMAAWGISSLTPRGAAKNVKTG